MAEKNDLRCLFNGKSSAAIVDKDGNVLASSPDLEQPFTFGWSTHHVRVGTAVAFNENSGVHSIKEDGFNINAQYEVCNVKTGHGEKFNNIKMTIGDFTGPKK